jgi:hypothetical protein
MNKKDNYVSSYEIGFLLSTIHGLIRLLAIITTFFFWLCLSALALVFLRLNLISLGQLSLLHQVLGIVGLSPILLTVLSWRIIEKIYSYYLTHYANKHTEIEKNS